jgi:hypothetical protein
VINRKAVSGVVFGIVLVTLGAAIGYCVRIFPAVSAGEGLNAVAAILGGLIGATGAALAVYLTLDGQRRDEAQKVEAALRMEVAEFGRLALAPLYVLAERVMVERARIPARDLPAIVAMPEAVVYRATADRISRLAYGSLFVAFHARIAEAVSIAGAYAASTRPVLREGSTERIDPMERMIDEAIAGTLATPWLDVCDLACTILRPENATPQIATAIISRCLSNLDTGRTRAREILKSRDTPASPKAI